MDREKMRPLVERIVKEERAKRESIEESDEDIYSGFRGLVGNTVEEERT